jgi:hypothetical protein
MEADALCIIVCVTLLRIARSPVAPAISAAYLPLALDISTWQYPPSIAIVTGTLAAVVVAYRRCVKADAGAPALRPPHDIDDVLETVPTGHGCVIAFAVFLLLACGLGTIAGLKLVLFPPLVVIAYEMFAHTDVCPWVRRPFTLPVACVLGAATGAASVLLLGMGRCWLRARPDPDRHRLSGILKKISYEICLLAMLR